MFDTLQAAVILAKFKYIDEFNERRRRIAEAYTHELSGVDGIIIPKCYEQSATSHELYHVYHQYPIRVKDGKRDDLQRYLKEKGISTMIYYPYPLHKMKVFEGRSKISGNLENAEMASDSVLSLPMEPLQDEVITEAAIKAIKEFYS